MARNAAPVGSVSIISLSLSMLAAGSLLNSCTASTTDITFLGRFLKSGTTPAVDRLGALLVSRLAIVFLFDQKQVVDIAEVCVSYAHSIGQG